MHVNQKISESIAVLTTIDPVAQGAGTVTSAWVSCANFANFMALVATGILGASATVDFKIQQAQDNAGTGVKDVTGKALAQIVKASGDGKQAYVNFRTTDLDQSGGFGFVRMSLTVGTASSLVAAILLGGNARFEPPRNLAASPQINLGASTVVQDV